MDDCDRAYEDNVTDRLEGNDLTPADDEFWNFTPPEGGTP